MNYIYEIFLSTSHLQAGDLDALNFKIARNIPAFSSYKIDIYFKDGIMRFFIESDKDISHVSEGLSLGVLKQIDNLPVDYSGSSVPKQRFLNLQSSKNIYEFRERIQSKKNLELELAVFKIKVLPMQTLLTKGEFYYNSHGAVTKSTSIVNGFPSRFLEINFAENKRYFKKNFPKYLNIEKALHGLSQNGNGAVLSVDGFPYFSDKRYLNLNSYQFDKHSFIIGSSGSGKSKFISLLISNISELQFRSNYKVIVIDPHASLAEDLAGVEGFKNIDFKDSSTDLFPDANSDVSAATELTATLFKSLMADSYNPKLETVLKFSLLVLLTAQAMSLPNLKMFITDTDFRNQLLDHVGSYVPVNVKKFFGSDFNELRTKHYNEAISPIASLVDEMQMQPAISNDDQYSLTKHLQENFLTVFSLNKVSMGEKVVKTVAGLLIQQIFLIAQSRVLNEKIIMFIDEVSVVQNPALAAILSEARKFNLFVVLTQQYFGQIEKDLQDSILTNVSNYYVFRISEEDARKLEGNLKISIPSNVLEAAKQKGQKEIDLRLKILTELNPRECIFRVEVGGQYLPCAKGRTLDIKPPKQRDEIKLKFEEPDAPKLPKKFVYSKDSENGESNDKSYHDPPRPMSEPQTDVNQGPAAIKSKLTSSMASDQDVAVPRVNPAPHSSNTALNQNSSSQSHGFDNINLVLGSSLGRAMLASLNSSDINTGPAVASTPSMSLKDVLASQSIKKK